MKKKCAITSSCKEKKTLVLVKNGYEILECNICGHRFSKVLDTEDHVRKIYSDDYFFAGKQGYPNYFDEKTILLKYGINYAKIISSYTSPGKVLDVGCAAGFILKGFEKSGWNCQGLEPNEKMATYGRDELNLHITTGVLETFKTNNRFDLISMIQVIGHFVEIDKSLNNAFNLLNNNGLVLVESWDMQSTLAKLMGNNWHEYSPPSVINWFSDQTITQLFNYHGFGLVGKGRPSKKININHGLSLIDESFPKFIFKKTLLKKISRIVGKYNINYPPVDLKWYLFKKL